MADDFAQYERKADDFTQYERPVEEPGWFQPGSKSEALARGFSNAATFGFGDEAQAAIRSYLLGQGKYKELRDQERAANAAAAEANPGSYIAGNIVGAIPQGMQAVRSGIAQGPKLIQQMYGAGKAGAGMGAVQGAGATEDITKPVQVAKDVAAGSAVNAAANAVGVPVAKVVSGVVTPSVKYLKNAATNKTQDATAARLKKAEEAATTPTPTVVNTAGSVLANKLSFPTLGALLNAGRVNVTNKNIDWSTDPLGAAAETGIAAGEGALGGAALKYGGRMLSNIGTDVLESGIKPLTKNVAQTAENLSTTGTSTGETFASDSAMRRAINEPFKTISGYLQSGKNSANPAVAQAAEEIEATATNPDNARKASMAAQATPEGRAVTNTESPVNEPNNSYDELDDYFRQIRSKRD